MKIYSIDLKEPEYDNYRGFMVVGESIPEILEAVYEHVCMRDGKVIKDIPYCLRSSNMNIVCIGEFTPCVKLTSKILFTDFYNA